MSSGRRGWRRGREKAFESGFVAGVLLTVRRAGDEPAEAVDDEEHRIGELRGGATRAGPELDEEILQPVGQTAHPHHADHAGGSLHGVRLAKDPIDRSVIVRGGLECEQPGGDALEVALGLLHEQWSEFVF